MRKLIKLIALLLLLLPLAARAQQAGLPGIVATPGPGGTQTYSLSIQTLPSGWISRVTESSKKR